MARTIKMNFQDNESLQFTLKKFSRGDLYGIKTVEKHSNDGDLLNTVYISMDGAHILPKGSTSSQFLDEDGRYIEKSEVELYIDNGEKVEKVPSMFDTGVTLEEISFCEYFQYDFKTSYYLDVQNTAHFDFLYEKCNNLFESEKLFKFRYVFRETHHPQEAILIPKDGKIIVVVGAYSPEIYNSPVLNLQEFSKIDDEDEIKFEDIW